LYGFIGPLAGCWPVAVLVLAAGYTTHPSPAQASRHYRLVRGFTGKSEYAVMTCLNPASSPG
jgi:hypothetical protein